MIANQPTLAAQFLLAVFVYHPSNEGIMNVHTTESFFKFLNANPEAVFTCAWMTPAGDTILPGFGCFFTHFKDVLESYNQLQARGLVTLHTTVNQTLMTGRRTEHISAARVLVLDLDRTVDDDELRTFVTQHKCHLIVESSPGKHHIYWKISPAISLERWSLYQCGLAHQFRGDKNMAQVTTMIRVPGFERLCKDGATFEPGIRYDSRASNTGNGSIMELTEKGILHQFPDIVTWGLEGQEELKRERRKIGELARKVWKEKESDKKSILAETPNAGRNTCLYIAVKDESYRKELNYEEAIEFARSLNNCFPTPLPDSEVVIVSRKAHAKAVYGLDRKAEAQIEAVALLDNSEDSAAEPTKTGSGVNDYNITADPDPTMEVDGMIVAQAQVEASTKMSLTDRLAVVLDDNDNSGNGNGNGHSEIRKEELIPLQFVPDYKETTIVNGIVKPTAVLPNSATAVDSATAVPAVAPREENQVPKTAIDIPGSLLEAAEKLGRRLWDGGSEEGRRSVKILAAALKMKQYQGLAKYLCTKWGEIGVFKKEGPVVYLKGYSRWGSEILYGVSVSRDNFQTIIGHALTVLGSEAIRHDEAKKDLKKIPCDSQLARISIVTFGTAETYRTEPRQPNNIIVFQNGVYNLDTHSFSEDRHAPLKYSHPLWCEFDLEVESKIKAGATLEQVCPVFTRYMADWFPGDNVIVSVLLRYMGYSMTTDYSRQKFAFFYGPTRAGKGSISRTLCALVGDHNYCSADYSMLDGDFKTAGIHDKLVITFEEVEGTAKQHESRMGYLKKILGGERVIFNRKYQEPFEDSVIGKFIFQSNEPPNYQDKGHAVRARMISIGFEKSFEFEDGPEPSAIILQSEANTVATLSCMAWDKARKILEAFEPKGSQALEVGKSEIEDSIDIIGSTIRKYLQYEPDGIRHRIKSRSIIELCFFVAATKDVSLGGRPELKVRQEMKACHPKSNYSNRFVFNGDACRGYVNISFNKQLILEDFPELLDSEQSHLGLYRNLLENLEL